MIRFAVCVLLLLQSVISIRPGFVHFVDGKADVRKFEQLEEGRKVQTGPHSRIEIGLGPDALLRLDEDSAAVLESLDPEDVGVRIESGTAVIEVEDIEKPNRIRVTADDLKTVIDSKGAFRFSSNTVAVLEGRIGISGTSISAQKGSQITKAGGDYKQERLVLNTPAVFKNFLNSPKAGFVNSIHGDANVKFMDSVRSDQPVTTGPASYAELLLRPGAFMRIDENSSVVFESVSANDIIFHVVSGAALIETDVHDERLPIQVTLGGTKTLIASRGLYRFTSDTAAVIDGTLRIGKNGEAVFTGMQVHMVDKVYDTKDLDEADPTGLDLWSAERAQLLAKANFIADYADSPANFFFYLTNRSYNAAWVYSPSINGITFMPQLRRESYYGTSFVPYYPLLPGPSMLPPSMVRAPVPQPTLSVVTQKSDEKPSAK
ncbi:MAG TPA: hypothetical protein VGK48_10060 [Terriglobia bacterium]|jgi:hypothetical protein